MAGQRDRGRGGGGRGGGGRGGGGRGGGGRGGGGRGGRRDDRNRPIDWDDMILPISKRTSAVIAEVSRRPQSDDNVGLWLDKFLYRDSGARKDIDRWSLKKGHREFALQQLARPWRSQAGADALARLSHSLADSPCKPWYGQVAGRLLVDYGRANTAETSVSFHHIWGVPRIAGSALKGLAAAAMRDDQAYDEAEYEQIFGTQAKAGNVIFYDALPVDGAFALAADVLTPHYGDYYRGNEPPGEWQSPVPHTFLTVVETTFVFHLGVRLRPRCEEADELSPAEARERARKLLTRARELLIDALQSHGVGAKTAAGYGRIRKTKPPPGPIVAELSEWLAAQKAAKLPQRAQLEQIRASWLARLVQANEDDRQRISRRLQRAITSPKLSDELQTLLDRLQQ